MAELQNNVALVFSASGISGWAVTKNLLSYPSKTTFSRVIALTHQPRTVEDSGLPKDPRLELYSGINLCLDLQNIKQQMHSIIPDLNKVTHVYYLAYANTTAYTENVMAIKDININITYNAVHAVNQLCSSLKFFILQTGTNNYSVAIFQHMDKIKINPPLREDNPRIPSPWGDEIFYYTQVNLIKEAAQGKEWRWCEVRPDQIIRHVPAVTSMTYVKPVALYLALYCYINRPGAKINFPGTKRNYAYIFTDSSQDIITWSEIYLSVKKPEKVNREGFNITDTATLGLWSVK